MYYKINVAKNGKHYFSTSDSSIRSKEKAKEVYQHFQIVFPESENYNIIVSYYETVAMDINLE
jgi:hypothetical protein